jgi:hypothetical protein
VQRLVSRGDVQVTEQVQVQRWCRGAEQVKWQCRYRCRRGAEVRRGRLCAEVQQCSLCRGADMEVQRCRVCDCAEVQRFSSSAEVEQMSAEVLLRLQAAAE